jgi:hypothetical protein
MGFKTASSPLILQNKYFHYTVCTKIAHEIQTFESIAVTRVTQVTLVTAYYSKISVIKKIKPNSSLLQ